jgi:hypothetical protein
MAFSKSKRKSPSIILRESRRIEEYSLRVFAKTLHSFREDPEELEMEDLEDEELPLDFYLKHKGSY